MTPTINYIQVASYVSDRSRDTYKSFFHCLKCVNHWVYIYKTWGVLVSDIVRIAAVKEWKTLHRAHCFSSQSCFFRK